MLKEQLIKHLKGGEAFAPIDLLLEDISYTNLSIRPNGLPYSFYELFYHIVFTQEDILKYILEANYKAPKWPDDYWSSQQGPNNEKDWDNLKSKFFKERAQLITLISKDEVCLDEPIKSNSEHTLFRELMLIVEHNAYHTGQLLIILRLLNLHS